MNDPLWVELGRIVLMGFVAFCMLYAVRRPRP